MYNPVRARIFARPVPTTPTMTIEAIEARLVAHQSRLKARVGDMGTTPEGFLDALEAFDSTDQMFHIPDTKSRTEKRAQAFSERRANAATQLLANLKRDDRATIEAAIGKGKLAGHVTPHTMHEKIAALHADAPWMAPASSAVMHAMNRRTQAGSGPFGMPPLILLGDPGVGKSMWARNLASSFAVPTVEIDIGAAQSAAFTIAGVERGWGSAAPGRVVRSLLSNHVVNPLVIVDEIDKIPPHLATSGGGSLPGAFEALKGMLEPATARSWTCPFYQLPFDISRVSWVMTTNTVDHIPGALLDRCKIIRIPDPTTAQLCEVARRLIADNLQHHDHAIATEVIEGLLKKRRDRRTSLRGLHRIVNRLADILSQPKLI